MLQRTIANTNLPAIGLGCMNISHAYGTPPGEDYGEQLLRRAFEIGVRHFDTAALYGFGKNEMLVGRALKDLRQEIHLASKCVLFGVDGKRAMDGSPATIEKTLDSALQRLQTDYIDLYYLHRLDRNVPIEDSVGALARAIEAGKIGAIGLSEMSAETIRKAHAVHPIAAVQSEYSPWSRNVEIAVLDCCKDIGATFVAFSPVARGMLAGSIVSADQFETGDIRAKMPRFIEPNFSKNLALVEHFKAIAVDLGCTIAQLCLAWCLHKGDHIMPIPGTKNIAHLEENMGALDIHLSDSDMQSIDALINNDTVAGARYPDATLPEIDTEDF